MIAPMKAIDRIMIAYAKTRTLTEEQAKLARRELSKFIHELMYGPGKPPDQRQVE
jgi:hypothetical protein